jgi:hypothetical protein
MPIYDIDKDDDDPMSMDPIPVYGLHTSHTSKKQLQILQETKLSLFYWTGSLLWWLIL